ncbi:uncharacterized protein MELLADRAFT_115826 [Melampsora larici-populina 98AG31]|uniref:Uncharacterized protein n=1 Tax=Melampsora larici-populina (strain 98AG31 / pathotype 3-4-7) TaxID=747676 RepID=F4REK5_MELLP|nr:uncharacterized protein MELLADRAFT_115826 [Melampsora larici-populina 98AG31]EGG09112.1 hypothetical protein MELLADRAFT_115826 [Melampsora larici-populina 98AG31]
MVRGQSDMDQNIILASKRGQSTSRLLEEGQPLFANFKTSKLYPGNASASP